VTLPLPAQKLFNWITSAAAGWAANNAVPARASANFLYLMHLPIIVTPKPQPPEIGDHFYGRI
jgi:hypothetical protein